MATKQIQISLSLEKELIKNPKWKLMLYLQEHGETSVYKLSKTFGWTTGKAHSIVNSLIKSKAVKARKIEKDGRISKMVKLVK